MFKRIVAATRGLRLLRGIDVSSHQGNIDWAKVRKSGVRFVWVKTTEGADFVDPAFNAGRVAAIRKARLKWGPYHYLRPRRDRNGAAEAAHAVRTAQRAGWKPSRLFLWGRRDFPLCVDVERGGNEGELDAMTGAQLRAYVSDFCDEVKRRTGRGCVVYLSPGFAIEFGGDAPRNGSVCWVAAWDAPDGDPPVPAGWKRRGCRFHQTGDNGSVPGIDGPVDTNVFMRLAGGGHPAPEPPSNAKTVQRLLRTVGWPIKIDGKAGAQTRQAIKDFQRGYARVTLTADGLVGPKTLKALEWSAEHDGRASEHFRFKEFASSRTGWIRTHRDLVRGLEKLRVRIGRPIGILSGFRDFDLGASKSQHKFGNAIDPTARLPLTACLAVKAFSGIGLQPGAAKGQEVRHVDVRHVGPNFTGGTPEHPTVFNDTF